MTKLLYQTIDLSLPIFGNVFERLMYNAFFEFLNDHQLLDSNQSGFRPGDSCVNQLISIAHMIYKAFDANPS